MQLLGGGAALTLSFVGVLCLLCGRYAGSDWSWLGLLLPDSRLWLTDSWDVPRLVCVSFRCLLSYCEELFVYDDVEK